MKTRTPEVSLEQLLAALERELIDATDEEVLGVAADLGMNPSMKGSAAFLGVKSPLLRAREGTSSAGGRSPSHGLSRGERSGPGGSGR